MNGNVQIGPSRLQEHGECRNAVRHSIDDIALAIAVKTGQDVVRLIVVIKGEGEELEEAGERAQRFNFYCAGF